MQIVYVIRANNANNANSAMREGKIGFWAENQVSESDLTKIIYFKLKTLGFNSSKQHCYKAVFYYEEKMIYFVI